jgi:hypothetical protein
MSNQTLRELAKDYAKGVIDKETYRKSRTSLITAITAGKITVTENNYAPPLLPASVEDLDATETIQRDRTEDATSINISTPKSGMSNATQSGKTTSSKNSPLMFIAISVVIVLSLIIAVILFYPKPPGTTNVETSSSAIAAYSEPEIVSNDTNLAGESLIADFLTERNWDEDSLTMFLDAWSALTDEERASAMETKRMQRMHDSIYKQFLEEKALESIDSAKAALRQQKLIDFANALGIDDARLVME